MKNIKKFLLPITMASILAGCQVTVPPANNQNSNNNSTNATTLTILDAKALKGSEKCRKCVEGGDIGRTL